jgi:hypothetical protein
VPVVVPEQLQQADRLDPLGLEDHVGCCVWLFLSQLDANRRASLMATRKRRLPTRMLCARSCRQIDPRCKPEDATLAGFEIPPKWRNSTSLSRNMLTNKSLAIRKRL